MADVRRFWVEHYADVLAEGSTWLDYSNERVQLQTFGLCLEASGGVLGLRCLDVGAGHGQFSKTLSLLGAQVVAIDLMEELVARHRTSWPSVEWRAGNLLDEEVAAALPESDRVFALEVLQCVPWEPALSLLWSKVAPGGRLVAMVPNASCPIVSRTIDRHSGVFGAPTVPELVRAIATLDGVDAWRLRALSFGADQRLRPYEVSPWTGDHAWSTRANRLQFVLTKLGTKL